MRYETSYIILDSISGELGLDDKYALLEFGSYHELIDRIRVDYPGCSINPMSPYLLDEPNMVISCRQGPVLYPNIYMLLSI